MKKLIFVILKLVEIPVIAYVPYWIFMQIEPEPEKYHIILKWLCGWLVILCGGMVIFAVGFGAYLLYQWNIKLAQWINDRLTR